MLAAAEASSAAKAGKDRLRLPRMAPAAARARSFAMRRPNLVGVVGAVVLALIALAALIGFGAGHYTNRTKTVGTVARDRLHERRPDRRRGRPRLRPVRLRPVPWPERPGRRFARRARAAVGGQDADRRAADAHHQPRTRRVGQPDQAVHAGLGRGDLEAAGRRARRLHPLRPAERRGRDPAARAARPGRGGGGRGALRPRRLHQLPRPERTRRRAEPALGGQDDPAALGRPISAASSTRTRRSPR